MTPRGASALAALLVLAGLLFPEAAFAQDLPAIDGAVDALASSVSGDEVSSSVRLVMLFTALTFLPALLLVMTPFTRFVIVFSLLRQALGLQQSPPNQVLVGLALFGPRHLLCSAAWSVVRMSTTANGIRDGRA